MARTDYYRDPHAPVANSIVVAVTAFVLDEDGRLLLVRRADNELYSIPGGAQDVGETISRAVVREVREETGIDVEATGLIGVYSDPEHVIAYPDGEVRQEFSLCFRAHPLGGQPRPSVETTEVHWAEQPELYELPIHPSIRLRIQHGFDERAEPYFD